MDELTSELDPQSRSLVLDYIGQLRKNQTVVFSTHLLDEALQLCDQVLSIQNGRVSLPELSAMPVALGEGYWVSF